MTDSLLKTSQKSRSLDERKSVNNVRFPQFETERKMSPLPASPDHKGLCIASGKVRAKGLESNSTRCFTFGLPYQQRRDPEPSSHES